MFSCGLRSNDGRCYETATVPLARTGSVVSVVRPWPWGVLEDFSSPCSTLAVLTSSGTRG